MQKDGPHPQVFPCAHAPPGEPQLGEGVVPAGGFANPLEGDDDNSGSGNTGTWTKSLLAFASSGSRGYRWLPPVTEPVTTFKMAAKKCQRRYPRPEAFRSPDHQDVPELVKRLLFDTLDEYANDEFVVIFCVLLVPALRSTAAFSHPVPFTQGTTTWRRTCWHLLFSHTRKTSPARQSTE